MSSLSVVIPCYNYGRFLEQAVGSVLRDQDGVDVRVLIIDDASDDNSAATAAMIAAREERVEALVHPVNKGNIATFNEGLLDWADGDYCLLLSADDRATPGALKRASDLLDAHPEAGFAYGHSVWFTDGASVPSARTTVRGWSVWPGRTWLERRFRQAENPITSPEIVVRTALQKAVGGYDPGLPRAADMEMYMRLAAHADVGFVRGADQAYHRLHGENMSAEVSVLRDLVQRRDVFEAVLDRYYKDPAEKDRLARTMLRQLGREALWAAGRVHDRGPLRRSEVGRRLLGGGSAEETDEEIQELLDFAVACWPDATRLSLFTTLQRRTRLGSRDLLYLVNQKGEWWLRRRSWRYLGV